MITSLIRLSVDLYNMLVTEPDDLGYTAQHLTISDLERLTKAGKIKNHEYFSTLETTLPLDNRVVITLSNTPRTPYHYDIYAYRRLSAYKFRIELFSF